MDKSLQRTVLWPTLYAQSFTCFDCSVFVVDGKCFLLLLDTPSVSVYFSHHFITVYALQIVFCPVIKAFYMVFGSCLVYSVAVSFRQK